jgi:hypothetical protein
MVIGPADEVGCPMPCRSAGKDAGSAPIIYHGVVRAGVVERSAV